MKSAEMIRYILSAFWPACYEISWREKIVIRVKMELVYFV